MNAKVEKFIGKACEILERELSSSEKNKFPKEFKGYIAGFGPSVRMSGLIATLAFYGEQKSAKENRSKVIDWLLTIIEYPQSQNQKKEYFNDILKNQDNIQYITMKEKELADAITALKLAFRTFPVEGGN